jgi:hypothetical protein
MLGLIIQLSRSGGGSTCKVYECAECYIFKQTLKQINRVQLGRQRQPQTKRPWPPLQNYQSAHVTELTLGTNKDICETVHRTRSYETSKIQQIYTTDATQVATQPVPPPPSETAASPSPSPRPQKKRHITLPSLEIKNPQQQQKWQHPSGNTAYGLKKNQNLQSIIRLRRQPICHIDRCSPFPRPPAPS